MGVWGFAGLKRPVSEGWDGCGTCVALMCVVWFSEMHEGWSECCWAAAELLEPVGERAESRPSQLQTHGHYSFDTVLCILIVNGIVLLSRNYFSQLF